MPIFSKRQDISQYTFNELLGQGSFARVHKVTHHSGYEVAIKVYEKRAFIMNDAIRKNLQREINVLKCLAAKNCFNCLRLYEVVETVDKVHLVVEFLNDGSLHQLIKTGIAEDRCLKILGQLMLGL